MLCIAAANGYRGLVLGAWGCGAFGNKPEQVAATFRQVFGTNDLERNCEVDGIPYFDDLYLDLVVYPDGTIVVDDMDELEEALSKQDITQEQFNLAIETSHRLKNGILSNISSLIKYTRECYEIVK